MIPKPPDDKPLVEVTTRHEFGLEALRLAMAKAVGADPKTVTVEAMQVLKGGDYGQPEWIEFCGLRVTVKAVD